MVLLLFGGEGRVDCACAGNIAEALAAAATSSCAYVAVVMLLVAVWRELAVLTDLQGGVVGVEDVLAVCLESLFIRGWSCQRGAG